MQRIIAAVLVLSGLGVIGWVALDDTGDDVGSVSIGAGVEPAATETTPAAPAVDADSTSAPSDRVAAGEDGTSPTEPTVDDAQSDQTAPELKIPEIRTRSARIGDVDLTPPAAPVSVSAPAFGVDARVVPVGIDPDRTMEIPEDVTTVGWYRLGSAPSEDEGTIILVGHVDSRVQGRGAFFDLRAADVGDEVTVTDADGVRTTWRVTGRQTYDKEQLPTEDVYRRDGAPSLLLITCGGDFDAEARSYESNVVVEAEPVP